MVLFYQRFTSWAIELKQKIYNSGFILRLQLTSKNELNIFQHTCNTEVRAVAGRLSIQAVVPAFLSLDKRRKESGTNINCTSADLERHLQYFITIGHLLLLKLRGLQQRNIAQN